MKISPLNNNISSVANMLNQRATSSKTEKNAQQTVFKVALRNLPKTNPNQVDDMKYNASYFDKNSNPSLSKPVSYLNLGT